MVSGEGVSAVGKTGYGVWVPGEPCGLLEDTSSTSISTTLLVRHLTTLREEAHKPVEHPNPDPNPNLEKSHKPVEHEEAVGKYQYLRIRIRDGLLGRGAVCSPCNVMHANPALPSNPGTC